MNTEPFKKHQLQLLEESRRLFSKTPISHATEQAYLANPRHLFVRRYREWGTTEWRQVTAENLPQHLATLYANRPLLLFGDDDLNSLSTISQPSFVLRMLDLLQLQPGHTVFELGAGSGWNAALLGHLVGAEGRVYSLEIIPEMAQAAAETIHTLGVANVSIITADGGDGHPAGAPYDRAIFTAGAYDLPRAFHDQLKDGALLLAVLKLEGGGDNLFLLRKTKNHFKSIDSLACGFVQLTGKHQVEGLEPTTLDSLSGWSELQHQQISETRYWWGGHGPESFAWRTMGIRFFLGLSEPRFRAFKTEKTAGQPIKESCFGLWDQERQSLVLAQSDRMIAYGNTFASELLLEKVRQWVHLGLPTAASFKLEVHPINSRIEARENQWLVKRTESQFLWTLMT
jgi:protein-L-isoaspartate(D-aspartate) O-methyltransferase